MTVVVGTAGHIDHGKTTLLRGLTGIDTDRLPEEQRRGMTIDVGYAHLALPDGTELDFVDVPGHDRLVGNMLVGAGEIDAALLVVAADDGPRAQTLEHLELLDGLGVTDGLAVVTKADLAPDTARREAVVDAVRNLLARTTLASAPVLVASAVTGEGIEALRAALVDLRDRVVHRRPANGRPNPKRARLAVDRVFSVRGHGAVLTGSLRGGPVEVGSVLRVEPGGSEVRVRGVQVHGRPVERSLDCRTALNVTGLAASDLRRGMVLAEDPTVVSTDRLLVTLRPSAALVERSARERAAAWPPTGTPLRLHVGTEQADAVVSRAGRQAERLPWGEAIVRLRLDRLIAAAPGDRFVLRRPSPPLTVAGGRVLDPRPPVGISRRRATPDRLAALATATEADSLGDAVLALHGALSRTRWQALAGPGRSTIGALVVAPDVLDDLVAATLATVDDHHDRDPASAGIPLGSLRTAVALDLRRRATVTPPDASGAASALLEDLVASERLARDGDRIRDPRRIAGPPPALVEAMARLEAALDVPAPPPFDEAVRASACPPEGVRALEVSGRIVRLSPDLAYAARTYAEIGSRALEMARSVPLSPAALRDATGTSRKYVLAIIEDLDRRGILARTPAGHVPGPRAGTILTPER